MVLNDTGPDTTILSTPRSPVLTRAKWDEALKRLKHFYLTPFRAIAATFRLFSRNRDRVRRFVRRPKVANALKMAMLVTVLLWLAIAFLNRDKDDSRLNDALQGLWSKTAGGEQGPGHPAD